VWGGCRPFGAVARIRAPLENAAAYGRNRGGDMLSPQRSICFSPKFLVRKSRFLAALGMTFRGCCHSERSEESAFG
jgi:hypothetical protein